MRAMRALQALELSLLATYRPSTCSPLLAMSTQTLCERQMPSTKTTRHTSPVAGGRGQMCKNSCVRLLKVLPPPAMSACLRLESSHPRDSSRRFAELPAWLAMLAPQDAHLHLVFPALVVPLRFILAPHEGHLATFISSSWHTSTFRLETAWPSSANVANRTHFLSIPKVGKAQLRGRHLCRWTGLKRGQKDTHFVL